MSNTLIHIMIIYMLINTQFIYSKTTEDLPFNCFQNIGSHNSYKKRIDSKLFKALKLFVPEIAKSIDYEHRDLEEQLSYLKARSLELDIYADPKGGHFYFHRLMPIIGKNPISPHKELKKPGFKVLHAPDVDFKTNCLSFKSCLNKIYYWSKKNPKHFPISILIEYKHKEIPRPYNSLLTKPIKASYKLVNTIDSEILSIILNIK